MAEIESLTTGQRYRSLAAAIGCTAVTGITMGLTWPLLALILDHQGVSRTLIGLSSASQSLAIFATAPLAPRAISRFGLVRTILGCIAITVVMLVLLPLFRNVFAWFPIRFLLGASVSTLFIATETWVNTACKEETRGRTIGVFGLLWAAGFAAGPLVIRFTGIEDWSPFLVGIALVLIAATPLLLVAEIAPKLTGRGRVSIFAVIHALPAAMSAWLLLGAVDYILDAFLPLYAMERGMSQATAVTSLTILLAGVTIAQVPSGWLSDRMDRQRLLSVLTAVATAASVLLPILPAELVLFDAAVIVLGAALGGIWTVSMVLVGAHFKGAELASAYTAGGVLHGLGMVTGPVVAGWAMDAWDPVAIPLIVSGCCFLYFPATLLRKKGA